MISKITNAALAYANSDQLQQAAGKKGGMSFNDLLGNVLGSVADTGQKAESLTKQVAAGARPELVDVVTAVTESEAALETLVAVRDKVVQAYDEVMRMPI